MQKVKGVPYLYIRNGVYYFRRAIPPAHRDRLGKREHLVSLGTGRRAEAMAAYAEVYAQTQAQLVSRSNRAVEPTGTFKSAGFSRNALEDAARKWVATRVEADDPSEAKKGLEVGWGGDPKHSPDDATLVHTAHRLAPKEDTFRLTYPLDTHWLAQHLIECAGGQPADFEKGSKEYRAALKIAAEAQREKDHRLRALALGTQVTPYNADMFAQELMEASSGGATRTLGQVRDEFVARQRGRVAEKTVLDNQAKLKLMLSVLGADRRIDQVEREDVRKLRGVLQRLPPRFKQRYPHCTPAQAGDAAEDKGVAPISKKTVNTYLDLLSSFFAFAEVEEYVAKNPATKLQLPIREGDRIPVRTFTVEELNLIFESPVFTGCVDDGRNYFRPGPNRPKRHRYWVPLIALYSGMRLSEICELQHANMVEEDGVLCFSVAALPWQNKKTANSRRLVPVHPTLIGLGLREYVDRQAFDGPLFPDLPIGKNGAPGDPMSKWFGRFLDALGMDDPGYRFHSFRHTWRTALRNAQVSEELVCRLGGWKQDGLHAHYGENARAATLYQAISKVDYDGLGLSRLR